MIKKVQQSLFIHKNCHTVEYVILSIAHPLHSRCARTPIYTASLPRAPSAERCVVAQLRGQSLSPALFYCCCRLSYWASVGQD